MENSNGRESNRNGYVLKKHAESTKNTTGTTAWSNMY